MAALIEALIDTGPAPAPEPERAHELLDPELRDRRAWLVWRFEHRPGREKPTKPPYIAGPGEVLASTVDPSSWRSFDEARAEAHRFDGIGLVLGDGLAGADFDGCRDPATGHIAPWALSIIDVLDSYTEVSPSGTGLHVLCFAELPPDLHGNRRDLPDGGQIELYDHGQYFTFTGQHLDGTPLTIERRTDELADLHRDLFSTEKANEPAPAPVPPQSDLADEDRLAAAFAARNGISILALFDGGEAGYLTPSEADAALAAHLAFYSDGNAATLERLMRCSGRVREKWDARRGRETWLTRECRRAVERHSGGWYVPRATDPKVRIDRRLPNSDLADEPLLFAALLAAGVADEEIATTAGISERTVRRWLDDLRAAGLEEIACTRPSRRFVTVPLEVLLDERLTKAGKVTLLHLAIYMNADGRATVSQDQLGKRRDRSPAKVGEDLRHAVRLGYLGATEPARFCNASGRRLAPNTYWWRDTVLAREAPAEAREAEARTPRARNAREGEARRSQCSPLKLGHHGRVTTESLAREGEAVPESLPLPERVVPPEGHPTTDGGPKGPSAVSRAPGPAMPTPSAPADTTIDARALHDLCRDKGLPADEAARLLARHGLHAIRGLYGYQEARP